MSLGGTWEGWFGRFSGGSKIQRFWIPSPIDEFLSNFEYNDFSLPFNEFKSQICYIRVVRDAFELFKVGDQNIGYT